MKLLTFIIIFNVILVVANGQEGGQTGPMSPSDSLLSIAYYNDCEGSDATNYTLHGIGGVNTSFQDYLVQCNSTNQRSVIPLVYLARSAYPAGAYLQSENLWLATGGPLQGKYLYEKAISLSSDYLKKRSSILGYSYVSSKSLVILISPKLDLNIFLAPTGAFEIFKRGSTTICKGKVYVF